MSKGSKGFTLIEILVSITLIGVGIASVLGGLGNLNRSEARNRDAEKMQRLAVQKFDELRATGQMETSQSGGDLGDFGETDYEWSLDVQPSGVENLNVITLTVSSRSAGESWPQGRIESLQYTPVTTGGTTP